MRFTIRFQKETAAVSVYLGVQQQHVGNVGLNYIHFVWKSLAVANQVCNGPVVGYEVLIYAATIQIYNSCLASGPHSISCLVNTVGLRVYNRLSIRSRPVSHPCTEHPGTASSFFVSSFEKRGRSATAGNASEGTASTATSIFFLSKTAYARSYQVISPPEVL